MYYEAVVENDETLTFVPDSHKNKKINNQAVDIYLSAIKFVPERFKT